MRWLPQFYRQPSSRPYSRSPGFASTTRGIAENQARRKAHLLSRPWPPIFDFHHCHFFTWRLVKLVTFPCPVSTRQSSVKIMATDSAGPLIIGLTVLFEAIAIIAVSLRFWAQRSLRRQIFAHDILIVAGLVCATALSITLILAVVLGGLGQHAVELYATPWKIVTYQKVGLHHGNASRASWKRDTIVGSWQRSCC